MLSTSNVNFLVPSLCFLPSSLGEVLRSVLSPNLYGHEDGLKSKYKDMPKICHLLGHRTSWCILMDEETIDNNQTMMEVLLLMIYAKHWCQLGVKLGDYCALWCHVLFFIHCHQKDSKRREPCKSSCLVLSFHSIYGRSLPMTPRWNILIDIKLWVLHFCSEYNRTLESGSMKNVQCKMAFIVYELKWNGL